MYWYIAPVFKYEKNDNVEYHPGLIIDGILLKAHLDSYICHAYTPKYDPTTVLIGVPEKFTTTPNGWSLKTLDEAKEYFFSVYNIQPTVEIY